MQRNLTVAQAQDTILEAVFRLPPEVVESRDALSRVLAEDVRSTRILPPADCSAMDGYAVRTQDLSAASNAEPASLRVAFEVAAGGEATVAVEAGQAARIFTGAPVPPGADAVIMQEHVKVDGDHVVIRRAVVAGDHIRRAGEDLALGDAVVEAGDVVSPAVAGLLASLGRTVVSVVRRPRVAILSSGDELVEPDAPIDGGRIVASNSYTLAAMCREVGAEPFYLGIAQDRPEDLETYVRAALVADCIVTSAGVSVGDHDHVKDVFAKLGCEFVFWGVRLKPGHPMLFGRFPNGAASGSPGPFLFGLPGNPVSAAVTFEQFVRPALRKMSGHERVFRPTVSARLRAPLQKRVGRMNLVRVTLEFEDGELWATSTGNQSSGVFRSMSDAHGLLVFPGPDGELAAGDEVTVQIIDDAFFAGRDRGFEGV